jgi:hypothetical protein
MSMSKVTGDRNNNGRYRDDDGSGVVGTQIAAADLNNVFFQVYNTWAGLTGLATIDGTESDLLNAIVGGGVSTINTSATISANVSTVLVNTDSAIALNVPTGLQVGRPIKITRVSSGLTTNGVTFTLSGPETIYGASSFTIFSNAVAKTAKYMESFTFTKLTDAKWAITDGLDSFAIGSGQKWERTFTGIDTKLEKGKRVLTGTTASTQGGITQIAHGLTGSKIISFTVQVAFMAEGGIIPEYTSSPGFQFHTYLNGGSNRIEIINHTTNSASILSKPIVITVWYEE